MARFYLILALTLGACTQLLAQDVTETVKATAQNIPEALTEILWNQLNNDQMDYFNGFLALALGYICVYSFETVYNWIFVIITFLGVHLVASSQIAEEDINLKSFEVMEVSLLGAYIAYKSSRGLNVMLGASIGYGVAKFCEDAWFSARGVSEDDMPRSWIVSWYALSVLVFIRIFNSKLQLKLLAVVSAFIGGGFLSAAVWYFVTIYSIGCCEDQLNKTWWATPKSGHFIDFLLILYKPGAADVGLFSGTEWRAWPTLAPAPANKWYGCLLWAYFFLVGARSQLKELSASAKKEQEGLVEPLLPQ